VAPAAEDLLKTPAVVETFGLEQTNAGLKVEKVNGDRLPGNFLRAVATTSPLRGGATVLLRENQGLTREEQINHTKNATVDFPVKHADPGLKDGVSPMLQRMKAKDAHGLQDGEIPLVALTAPESRSGLEAFEKQMIQISAHVAKGRKGVILPATKICEGNVGRATTRNATFHLPNEHRFARKAMTVEVKDRDATRVQGRGRKSIRQNPDQNASVRELKTARSLARTDATATGQRIKKVLT
jgi:hypothetical protein